MIFETKFTLIYFFESLKYEYLQKALISTIIVGVVCGIIGVFIILKGMSFLGAGIAHSCFAGGALAILIGTDPFFSILIFGEVTALTIGYINEKTSGQNDTTVGVIFSFTMALAILFIGLIQGYSTNIQSLLFGNALLITDKNLLLLIIFSVLSLGIFFSVKKEFLFIIFDESMAEVSGIPVKLLNYLFLTLIAIIITISLKAIGAILVFAMIVTPAAAAYQWTYNVDKMLVLSVIFGVFSSIVGLIVSFILEMPTGSTIVLCVTLIFGFSFIFSPKRRENKHITSIDKELHTNECRYCQDLEDADCDYCACMDDPVNDDCEEHLHTH
jgi:zinc transport system permease protein